MTPLERLLEQAGLESLEHHLEVLEDALEGVEQVFDAPGGGRAATLPLVVDRWEDLHDRRQGRVPVAVTLAAAAELLDVDPRRVRRVAARLEPFTHADGSLRWSLGAIAYELGLARRNSKGRLVRPSLAATAGTHQPLPRRRPAAFDPDQPPPVGERGAVGGRFVVDVDDPPPEPELAGVGVEDLAVDRPVSCRRVG